MSENENMYDISKHPVVVIALAVVGTFGFSYQFVLPIMTAKLQNDVEKIPAYENQIKEDNVKIDELNKKLQQIESQLAIAQNANLFTHDDPYPVGLGKIRIGDSINSLTGIYENIRKGDDYWQVKNSHSIFIVVTYFFNDQSSKKEITHILFHTDFNMQKKSFLQEVLENKFGKPKHLKNDAYLWKVPNGLIHKFDDFSFVLYPLQKK